MVPASITVPTTPPRRLATPSRDARGTRRWDAGIRICHFHPAAAARPTQLTLLATVSHIAFGETAIATACAPTTRAPWVATVKHSAFTEVTAAKSTVKPSFPRRRAMRNLSAFGT